MASALHSSSMTSNKSAVHLLEYELNRSFISDLLHICYRAAVTAVPLIDEILLESKFKELFCLHVYY